MKAIANKGFNKALRDDKNLMAGLNVFDGMITYRAVAEALGHKFFDPQDLI